MSAGVAPDVAERDPAGLDAPSDRGDPVDGGGAAAAGRVVVIGNFDGLHRGHQAVCRDAATLAASRGLAARLLTFHPHPAEVLGRGAPPLLTSRARKRELVLRLAPPIEPWEQPFDRAFAAQSPREFAERLAREHAARVVVVGADFRFGHRRAGDLDALAALGRELGFEAAAHALVSDGEAPISSTRVRAAIADGHVDEAARLLGRPHMLEGVVERGKQLGRTIGFPTCNLGGVVEMAPALGIYATLVDRIGDDGRPVALARGATSVGTNPTVDDSGRRTVETYLFDGAAPDFERELYGARLRVHLVARLRPEARFDGLEALVSQMRRDVEEARRILAERRPDPAHEAWA